MRVKCLEFLSGVSCVIKVSIPSDYGLILHNAPLDEGRWGWRDGLVAKSSCCFPPGPELIPSRTERLTAIYSDIQFLFLVHRCTSLERLIYIKCTNKYISEEEGR